MELLIIFRLYHTKCPLLRMPFASRTFNRVQSVHRLLSRFPRLLETFVNPSTSTGQLYCFLSPACCLEIHLFHVRISRTLDVREWLTAGLIWAVCAILKFTEPNKEVMSLLCFYLVSPPILSVLMQVRSPSKNGFGSPVTLLPRLISFHSSWLTF